MGHLEEGFCFTYTCDEYGRPVERRASNPDKNYDDSIYSTDYYAAIYTYTESGNLASYEELDGDMGPFRIECKYNDDGTLQECEWLYYDFLDDDFLKRMVKSAIESIPVDYDRIQTILRELIRMFGNREDTG